MKRNGERQGQEGNQEAKGRRHRLREGSGIRGGEKGEGTKHTSEKEAMLSFSTGHRVFVVDKN